MKKPLLTLLALLTALLALAGGVVQAQDSGTISRIGYYLAPDANGVQQVYQLLLDGQSEPRQITRAESDVLAYSAAYDGLAVAYISGGWLWLQPIHTEEAEALAPVSADALGTPVFSQDGQYVAYADQGVWLVDLSTRETRQLLGDVSLDAAASNAGAFRIFQPERFVLDEAGRATKLIVDVGVWEWNTVGVYDLETGEWQELGGQVHTSLLPLHDGSALLYGNGGVAGEFALHIADSLNAINAYSELVSFASLTDATLFADQAVEIQPGVVRVFGSAIGTDIDSAAAFAFDYDLTAGAASDVQFITLSESDPAGVLAGSLSPDGALLPVYENASFTGSGTVEGELKLLDLATGETLSAAFPEIVRAFRWQP